MRSFLILTVVVCASFTFQTASNAGEPRTAPTLSDAVEMAKTAPGDIVVLVTGSDWHPGSMKFLRDVFETSAFRNSLGGDVILVHVDHTEAAAANKEKDKKNNLGRYLFQVPLIGLYDAQGRDIGQLTENLESTPVDGVASQINELITKRKERDQLWEQATKVQGKARADLLGKSLELMNIGWGINESYRPKVDAYKPVLAEIKASDPKDALGWQARYEFQPYKLLDEVTALAGKGQHNKALATIDEVLENKHLPVEYRQRALAAKYAVFSRWKNHEKEALKVLEEIRQLDPDSLLGLGAQGYAEFFTGPVDLKYGWRPHHVQQEWTTWEVDVTPQIGAAGFYQLELNRYWNVGKNNISVKSIVIEMNGEKVWSRDKEGKPNFEEIVELPEVKGRKVMLKIEAKGERGTDSSGTISIKPYYIPATSASTGKPA
ncbi:MAG: hypothetical protein C0478_05425 [Planctomyces sp.]|nr:hypothetical protein [Planctomyces sp.]